MVYRAAQGSNKIVERVEQPLTVQPALSLTAAFLSLMRSKPRHWQQCLTQVVRGQRGTNGTNGTGFTYKNAWNSAAPYSSNDVVTENGQSYVALLANSAIDHAADVDASAGGAYCFTSSRMGPS